VETLQLTAFAYSSKHGELTGVGGDIVSTYAAKPGLLPRSSRNAAKHRISYSGRSVYNAEITITAKQINKHVDKLMENVNVAPC